MTPVLHGKRVFELLQDANVDVERWEPHTYCASLEGWRPLDDCDTFELGMDERETPAQRIDVQLYARQPAGVSAGGTRSSDAAASRGTLPEGYFV